MLARLAAVLLISLTCTAMAADAADDFPAFPFDPGSATASGAAALCYTLDTPIQTLATDPAANAIVDANIPGLLEDGNYFLFKGMSLKTVASLSHGQISTDALQTIAGQLKFGPISVASANAQAH